jgi:Asp-tRNA(Asn)/Glu-tRNA(Gln) amidotransferase C subunit
MKYLVTWVEGDEVEYRIIPAEALAEVVEAEKGYIVVPLQ